MVLKSLYIDFENNGSVADFSQLSLAWFESMGLFCSLSLYFAT